MLKIQKVPCLPEAITAAHNAKWVDEAQALMSDPGEWYRFPDSRGDEALRTLAYRINIGMMAAFRPNGHFEAVTRNGSMYVRYVGSQEKRLAWSPGRSLK